MKFYLFKNSFQQWHDTHYQQRHLVQKSNLRLAKLFYLRKGFQKFQKALQLYKEIFNFQSKCLVSSRLYDQEKKMGKYLNRWKVFTQQTAQIKYLNRMKSVFFYKLFRQMKALKQWATMAEMWKRKRTLIRQAKENYQAHLKKKSIYLLFHSLFDDDEESEKTENDSNYGKPKSFFPPSLPQMNKRISLQQLYQKRVSLKYYWQQWKELLREQFERKKRENDEIQQEYQRKYLSRQSQEKESQPHHWQLVESLVPNDFANSAPNQSMNKYNQLDYSSILNISNNQRTESTSLNPLARLPPRQLRDHSSLSFLSVSPNNQQLSQLTNQQHQLFKAPPRDYSSSSYSIPGSDPFNTGNHFSYYIPPYPSQQNLPVEIPKIEKEKNDEKEQNDMKEENLANEIFVIEEIINNFMNNAHLITNEEEKKDLLLQLQKEVELLEQKLKNTKS
jgi:hypothetical protein